MACYISQGFAEAKQLTVSEAGVEWATAALPVVPSVFFRLEFPSHDRASF